ncbi:hypothetical protein BSFA1_88810 (plasmid) [Burkholderia sp. SFA1]|nr:hypothetical protein BSFA1_88810 [Burkholderia sp. SFA1]
MNAPLYVMRTPVEAATSDHGTSSRLNTGRQSQGVIATRKRGLLHCLNRYTINAFAGRDYAEHPEREKISEMHLAMLDAYLVP